MRIHCYKKFCLLLALIMICSALISSCNKSDEKIENPHNYKFSSDERSGSFIANMYTVKNDELYSYTSNIDIYNDISPLNALLQTLFANEMLSKHMDCEYKLIDAALSFDICLINISGAFPKNISRWFALEAVVTSTLHDFCGINYVCIMIDSQMPEYKGLPLGMYSYSTLDLAEYIFRRTETFKSYTQNVRSPVKSNLLYCMPIYTENYIYATAEADKIFSQDDAPVERINALLQAYVESFTRAYNKENKSSCQSCFSWELDMNTEELYEEGIVSLNVDYTSVFYIESEVLSSCVALTIICNLPSVKTVNVTIGDISTSYAYDLNKKVLCTDFYAYYPKRDESTLEKERIILPSSSRYDAKEVLKYMLEDEYTKKTLFPDYLKGRLEIMGYSDDVLKVYFPEDARAEVIKNFIEDEEHYDSMETRERLFVFSLVNTLTQLPNVKQVIFLCDSDTASDKLINIHLGMPLYENPGLNADG